jgi:hypothetical protein
MCHVLRMRHGFKQCSPTIWCISNFIFNVNCIGFLPYGVQCGALDWMGVFEDEPCLPNQAKQFGIAWCNCVKFGQSYQ